MTTAGATIAADEIIDLVHSIKSVYRKKATFLMNDSTIKAIRKLKDGSGQYLWQPGLKEGQPDMLLNYRIATSPYMPEVAAGKKVILFGDFKSYWIADRQSRSFQRLNELFAVTGQVGFRATQRVDGRLVLAEALEQLTAQEREIVLMAVVGGLKSTEIAEITGLRPGSVRSKLSRSLARMRRYLESE